MVETEQVGVIGNWISCSGTLKFKDIRNISRLFFFFKVNWSLPVMLETVQPRGHELTKRTPNTPMFQDFQESSISFLGSLKYYSVKVLILLGSAFIFHLLSVLPFRLDSIWLAFTARFAPVFRSEPNRCLCLSPRGSSQAAAEIFCETFFTLLCARIKSLFCQSVCCSLSYWCVL